MELQDAWDKITDFGTALTEGVNRGLVKLFGNANERQVRRLAPMVQRINALEPQYEKLSDAELKETTLKLRARRKAGALLDELLPDAFAAVRESSKRFLKMRHYDVQLLGGMVLHHGKIAEMVTGEGKTLVASCPTYLNAIDERGVHVVTVNDYLARRDAEWMSPLFSGLGMTIGAIQSNMDSEERQRHYGCDITYGTANEFGFDYLRDNMKPTRDLQAQRVLHYAIIDEVDSILIDEARTPLIISGNANDDPSKYPKAHQIALQLKKDIHFEVKEKEHTCHLTDAGVLEAEKLAGLESFYTPGNMEWPHLIDNALKANYLYRRDKHYLVRDQEIVIIDEHTDRAMEGRQWSDGLHQAVEAKERVRVKEETQTLATITLQNFFKLYKKISGMTGTAMTEANEFYKIYKLDVVAIPTNKPLIRENYTDVIFGSEKAKWRAVLDEVKTVHRTGRPILVGTSSVGNSEMLSEVFKRNGIKHEVLNAKYVEREAEIIAQAGRRGAITISTNMAGRGTDIILGGNPDMQAWADLKNQYPTRLEVPPEVWREAVAKYETPMKAEGRELVVPVAPEELLKLVKTNEPKDAMLAAIEKMRPRDFEDIPTFAANMGIKDVEALAEFMKLVKASRPGGLHVVGTERHESRRIDNQLRGRSGRQGDPGSGRFYLSLEDDLMRKFMGDSARRFLEWAGLKEDEPIESPMLTRQIQGAQRKVEERNFEIRKNLLEYDEIMDIQRKRVYGFRQRILDGMVNTRDIIFEMTDRLIDKEADKYFKADYGQEQFAAWASEQLGMEFRPRQFRRHTFAEAERAARAHVNRVLNMQIREAVDDHLNRDVEQNEWNWEALTNWSNNRFGTKLKSSDLKRESRDNIEAYLEQQILPVLEKVSLDEGQGFFAPDYARMQFLGEMNKQFGFGLTKQEAEQAPAETKELIAWVKARARQVYSKREVEFPVKIAMARYMSERGADGASRFDREGIANWAKSRFQTTQSFEDFLRLPRQEIFDRAVSTSEAYTKQLRWEEEVPNRIKQAFGSRSTMNGTELAPLADWAEKELGGRPDFSTGSYNQDEVTARLLELAQRKFRPELYEAEKQLVLRFLDMSWKDHLYSMDHLRAGIGLVSYAQIDPKVEYKRRGKAIFEEMWTNIDRRVTNLAYHMEELDGGMVSDIWQITNASHEAYNLPEPQPHQAGMNGDIRSQQASAIESQRGKVETIRNSVKKVGRNDPCPCGSGKKYKSCCMD